MDQGNSGPKPGDPKGVQAHMANRHNAIGGDGDLKARVLAILKRIDEVGLDLLIILDPLSWGCDAVTEDSVAKYQRGLLMDSVELPQILNRWEGSGSCHSSSPLARSPSRSRRASNNKGIARGRVSPVPVPVPTIIVESRPSVMASATSS